MIFTRRRVEAFSEEQLRALGARSGVVIDSPEALRVGLGAVVDTLELPDGLTGAPDTVALFSRHRLTGDAAPPGTGLVLFGALPFAPGSPGSLHLYEVMVTQFRDGPTWVTSAGGAPSLDEMLATVEVPSQETQTATSLSNHPSGATYAHNVARAVERLRHEELQKVVLARSVTGEVDEIIDPAAVAQRLRRRETICTIYAVSVGDGNRFVGASPELLVSCSRGEVRCHPLAGTIAIPPNINPDDYQKWLLGSAKNLREHSLLVEAVLETLSPLFDVVSADEAPSIVALRTVAHLGTWIRASHPVNDNATALDFVAALHPTAAVAGLPQAAAIAVIEELEEMSRGFYAGPIGWVDEAGDGEWWIAIRGVIMNGRQFEAWAGAGIVSESDPVAERQETKDKLSSILAAVLVDRL